MSVSRRLLLFAGWLSEAIGNSTMSSLHNNMFLFNMCSSCCFRYILTLPSSDKQPAKRSKNAMVKSFGGTWFVRCMEAVRISESPLWEVPLYKVCDSMLFIIEDVHLYYKIDLLLKNLYYIIVTMINLN